MSWPPTDRADRRRAIRRVTGPFSGLGVEIPEELELEGYPVPLRRAVGAFESRGHLDGEEAALARALMRSAKRRLDEIVARMEEETVSRDELDALEAEGLGLRRAQLVLDSLLDPVDHLAPEVDMEKRFEDAKRWTEYLRRVAGSR